MKRIKHNENENNNKNNAHSNREICKLNSKKEKNSEEMVLCVFVWLCVYIYSLKARICSQYVQLRHWIIKIYAPIANPPMPEHYAVAAWLLCLSVSNIVCLLAGSITQ